MAMPQPQADNRFPGRTAIQPPLALGASAGGEKTAAGESELKKPSPAIDKPAPKTSFAASVAATAPISPSTSVSPKSEAASPPAAANEAKEGGREKPDGAGKPEQPRKLDWGLSLKKKRPGLRLKIGAAAAVLACAAGGYAVYSQLSANKSSGEGPSPETAQREEPAPVAPAADSPDTGDPFDETPAVLPAASSRSPSAAEPRRIGRGSDDATPIGRRNAAVDQPGKNPLHDIVDLDEDEPRELSEETRALDLAPAGQRNRKTAEGPSLGDEADPPSARTAANARRTRERQAGAGSGPGLPAGGDDAGPADDLSDEKLEGYSVAERRTAGGTNKSAGSPAVSIVEVDDDPDRHEKLDGYVPQDVTSHRARSTTLVVRAPDAGLRPGSQSDPRSPATHRSSPSRATAFGADVEFDGAAASAGEDAEETFARPSRGEINAIQRRTTPPAPAADRRFFPGARSESAAASSGGPAGDTYRVAPDDNFWKISRKQYGTARYYQALMRYNQDRVPDPQKLRPGTQILTPPAAVLEQRFPDLIEKPASGAAPAGGAVDRSAMRPGFDTPFASDDDDQPAARTRRESGATGYFYGKSGEPMYRIGPDDTLTGIAQRHLGRASRWHEIYEKNPDVLQSPDNLTPGTVIRLPVDASRVSLVPDGDRRR